MPHIDVYWLQAWLVSGPQRESVRNNSGMSRDASPGIQCADGFELSAQANSLPMCEPQSQSGPYKSAEVQLYGPHLALNVTNHDGGALARVPLAHVVDCINSHGGPAVAWLDGKAIPADEWMPAGKVQAVRLEQALCEFVLHEEGELVQVLSESAAAREQLKQRDPHSKLETELPASPRTVLSDGEVMRRRSMSEVHDLIRVIEARLAARAAAAEVTQVRESVERLKTIDALTKDTQWLSAAEIQASTASGSVEDWTRRRLVCRVAGASGEDLFPAYQFDAALQPLPVIEAVLQALGSVEDPWALVAWFHYPNGWLVDPDDPERRPRAPKDFLDHADAVIQAARRGSTYIA